MAEDSMELGYLVGPGRIERMTVSAVWLLVWNLRLPALQIRVQRHRVRGVRGDDCRGVIV